MTVQTRVPDFRLEAAFDQSVAGVFYIETSALDGQDGLSDGNSFQFGGTFDDITDDIVDDATVVAGTDALAGAVQAGNLTVDVLHPSDLSRWNPNNPSSPLNGVSPGLVPMRPVRLRAVVDGPAASPLTVSGNEITDLMRASALAWTAATSGGGSVDPYQADSSFGIWEGYTNLFRRGQCDATTDFNAAGAVVAVDATVVPPYSTQSIKVTTAGGSVGQGVSLQSNTGLAAAAGQFGVGAVYFSGVPGASYDLNVRWLNTDATQTDGTILTFNAGAGVFPTVTLHGVTWEVITPAAVAVAVGKTGDKLALRVLTHTNRVETFWVAHGIVKKGTLPLAPPYIPTSGGATAFRSAADVRAPSNLVGVTQGWAAIRMRLPWAGASAPNGFLNAFGWTSTGSDEYSLFLRQSTAKWEFKISSLTGGTRPQIAATHLAGGFVTLVARWSATDYAISVNGSAFVSGSVPPTFPIDSMNSTFTIGSSGFDTNFLNGNVMWFACGTGQLTDADAAKIAAFGNTDPNPADFADHNACTATWSAATSTYTIPGGTSYGLFWGFIRRADWNSDTCACQLYCEDLLLWMSRSYPVIASTGPTTTGAAIGLILNAIGWTDPNYRHLDTGDQLTDFSADGSVTALQLIQDLLTAERGTVYHRGDGVLVYEQRSTSRVRATSWTLDDELFLQDSGIDVDTIYTRATVQKTGGVAQTAINPTAELNYGRSDLPDIQSPYIPSDAAAALMAADLLYETATGKPPVTISVDNDSDATELAILTSPLLSVFTISETLGGTSGDFVVQRVQHKVKTGKHETEYLLQKRLTREFDVTTSAIDGSDVLRY